MKSWKLLWLFFPVTGALIFSTPFAAHSKDAEIPATFIGEWCSGDHEAGTTEYNYRLPSWTDDLQQDCAHSKILSIDGYYGGIRSENVINCDTILQVSKVHPDCAPSGCYYSVNVSAKCVDPAFTSYDNTTPTFTRTFELSRYKGNIYLKMPKSKRQ
jgi:hypothetical protein